MAKKTALEFKPYATIKVPGAKHSPTHELIEKVEADLIWLHENLDLSALPAKTRSQVEKRISSAFTNTRNMRSAIFNAVYNRRQPEMEEADE